MSKPPCGEKENEVMSMFLYKLLPVRTLKSSLRTVVFGEFNVRSEVSF